MKNKVLIAIIASILVAAGFVYFFGFYGKVKPTNLNFEEDGLVYNEDCAVKIAEAIWLPIYGSIIYNSKPFNAKLQDSVWVVEGTVHAKFGGAPFIKIRKKDGKILEVAHYN